MAQIPYNPVPQVQASDEPIPSQRIDADPSMFGAGVGRGVQNVGQTLVQVADHFQQIKNETDSLNASTNAAQELGGLYDEFHALEGENRVNAYPAYQKKVQDIQDRYAQSMGNPQAQLGFLTKFRGYADRALTSFGTLAGDAAEQARDGAQLGAISTAQSQAVRNYGTADNSGDIENIVDNSLSYAHVKGWDKSQADAFVQKNVGKVYEDIALSKLAASDTAGARQTLDEASKATVPGTDLPVLDAQSQLAIQQHVEAREDFDERHALDADLRADRLAEHERKQQADASGDAIIKGITKDPFSITPNQIANAPGLSWQEKNELMDIARRRQNGEDGEGAKDTKTYGSAFYDYYRRVTAPDGDPNKLSDQSQIYPLVGKGLTVSGADKLISEINGKKTPEGESESEMKRQFLKNAHAQISGEDEGLRMKDPKGEELYLKFLAQALPAIETSKKDGKSAAQMFNPESPEYIGKSINAFKRPFEQWTADLTNANDPDAAAALDTSTPQGLLAAVKSGRVSRADGERIAAERGYIRKPVAPPEQPAPLTPLQALHGVSPVMHSESQGPSVSQETRALPAAGALPGDLHLDASIAPKVPAGAPRPFAPGEWVDNPDGSWSSEISMTVEGDKRFNGGKATVIPSLWLINGKPVRAKSEDEAVEYALKSGLKFHAFKTLAEADKFANDREDMWQKVGRNGSGKIPPLWERPVMH